MFVTNLKSSKIKSYLVLPFILVSFIACKKQDYDGLAEETPSSGSRKELTLDSIFLYAKEIYYWQDALPGYSTFDPRNRYSNISPASSAFQKELYDITQFKLNPSGIPYERTSLENRAKYSYIEDHSSAFGNFANIPNIGTDGEFFYKTGINNAKVSYLYLASFDWYIRDTPNALTDAFDEFAAANTETLIIDLRNNPGGYVASAAYLADLIVPSRLRGKVMYSEHYNATLQSGNARLLKNQVYFDEDGKTRMYKGRQITLADLDFTTAGNTVRFDKKGKLETIKQVYFIVSPKTASASELLINCLKPHLTVKLVGDRTYGKPLGFFPVKIDTHQVYFASFLLNNAEGRSDYFDGIPPDVAVYETSTLPMSDPQEPYLKATLQDIANPSLATKARHTMRAAKPSPKRGTTMLDATDQMDYIPIIKQQFKLKD